MYDFMIEREKLSNRIYYTGLNEKSRFNSALQIMRTEKMITSEAHDALKEKAQIKADLTLKTHKELGQKKKEEIDEKRKEIIEQVNNWKKRMFELHKTTNK